jgi:hypothetical protein
MNDKLIEHLSSMGYKATQTNDKIKIKLPKFVTVILDKTNPQENIITKFGRVRLGTAITLLVPCYLLLIYISFHSMVGFLIVSLVLIGILHDISRYRRSLELKKAVKEFYENKV